MRYSKLTSSSDPGEWTNCSYCAHPVDQLEPELPVVNAYRESSVHFLHILLICDSFMRNARDGVRAWIVVSIVLGLPSTRDRTLTQIANEIGVTKQAISRSCTHLSRMLGLEPAFGMKSIAARQKYAITNGRNGH